MSEPNASAPETTEVEEKPAETKSRDEQVAVLAYEIWEELGRPDGKSEEHWLLACAMVDAETEASMEMPQWLSREEQQPMPKSDKSEKHPPHQLHKRSAA